MQTRGLVVLDGSGSRSFLHTIYAVHALKVFSFSLLNGEIWIPVGLVVPWWSSFGTAFVDTGAGCPAVVSGSRGLCRREDWLSSTARAPETRVRGLTPHCRRDPRNTKGDKTNSLGLLSAWAPWRSEVGVWCGDSLVAVP